MTDSIDLNESVTLKRRLQEAYNNVALCADNYFAEDEHFRRSNQMLISKIKQLREEERQNIPPKNVLDVIPGSNLTKYGEYQYNDARELCYTHCPHQIHFRYPYFRENETRNEPWMTPEVEWVYMHTMYAGSNNFKVYEGESIDWTEKLNVPAKDKNNGTELPEISNPAIEVVNNEKAVIEIEQLKKQEKKMKLLRNLPYFFDVAEYKSAMIRESILSEEVKNLWDQKQLSSRERILEVHKSVLDNIFFQEEEYKPLIGSEFTNLQNLIISIVSLNEKLPKHYDVINTQELPSSERSITSESLPTPQRRLYSDVVQGNKSSEKVVKILQEPQSPKSDSVVDDAFTVKTSGSLHLPTDSLASSSSVIIETMHFDVASSTSSTMDSPIFLNDRGNSLTGSQPSQSPKPPASKVSYSEAVNSNQFNLPYGDNHPLMEPSPIRTNSFQNYNPISYMTNMNQNPNLRLGFRNYAHNCQHGFINPPQQQIPINRTQSLNVNQNSCQHMLQPQQAHQQHPSWYIPQYRTPNYGMVLLPQLPTKHRWAANPHYLRPPTPPQLYTPNPTQNLTWASQSATVHRSNSNQQVNACFMSAYDPNKQKKKCVAPLSNKFVRSKPSETRIKTCPKKETSNSLECISSLPNRILNKQSWEDLIHLREESETHLAFTENEDNDESLISFDCVDASKEQDLERIALVEYQISDERLYQEIERQAKEQYDGNPENLRRPPNRIWNFYALFLGGLHFTNFRLSLFVNT